MPQLYEICSRCHNNWMGCTCDNFNPPTKVTEEQLKELRINHKTRADEFSITRKEAEQLYEYFMHAGYIGFELEYDIITHRIVRRLGKFLGKGSRMFGVDK